MCVGDSRKGGVGSDHAPKGVDPKWVPADTSGWTATDGKTDALGWPIPDNEDPPAVEDEEATESIDGVPVDGVFFGPDVRPFGWVEPIEVPEGPASEASVVVTGSAPPPAHLSHPPGFVPAGTSVTGTLCRWVFL